jgi:hypothetical protein
VGMRERWSNAIWEAHARPQRRQLGHGDYDGGARLGVRSMCRRMEAGARVRQGRPARPTARRWARASTLGADDAPRAKDAVVGVTESDLGQR